MILFEYPILFLVSYLFGSFPSAYIIVKIFYKKDIREVGSGNVGTVNTLRAGKSKWLALLVLVFDMLKGAIPSYYFTQVMPSNNLFLVVLVSGVLLGHVFPVWLKFNGGRGLAVVAGSLLIIHPILVGIWSALWIIFYMSIRKHIIASMVATFSLPIIVYFLTDTIFDKEILLMILPVCMLIFERHLKRIPDLVREKKLSINNGEI